MRHLVARGLAALALGFATLAAPAAEPDPARWVNPFIGTDGTGHVMPAAAVPWGMVMPGPDHADRGRSHSSGHQWRAPQVPGFSNTHISGAGIPKLGDVLLMPVCRASPGGRTRPLSPPRPTRPARRPRPATTRCGCPRTA
jgi:putative alpha-1,2-mannosidase